MTVLGHMDKLRQVCVGQSLLGLLQPHPGEGEDLEALHHPGPGEQVADQREGHGQAGVRRRRYLIRGFIYCHIETTCPNLNQLEKLEAAKTASLVCISLTQPYCALLSFTGLYRALLGLT